MARTKKRQGKYLPMEGSDGLTQKRAIAQSAWERLWDARHSRDRCRGRKLDDMPGIDRDSKKLNWFLFRRGLLEEGDGKKFMKWNRKQAARLKELKNES